jgi:endogenous inhibitor of DNA gyrase (YacG/DUF329 family)
MIDLGTWAAEEYRVPGKPAESGSEHPDDLPPKNRILH